MERKVLYFDDDEEEKQKLSNVFKGKESLDLLTADSREEAEKIIEEKDVRCLIVDLKAEKNISKILEMLENRNNIAPILFTDKDFESLPPEKVVGFSAYVSKSDDSSYRNLVDDIESILESSADIDYPVPETEDKRLNAVERYDIEDLMNDEGFQRLSEIGSRLFNVKFCFIGLVGETKEQFLSFHGSETEELDRSCTMCTFTINQDDVMVVEDRETDPRFKYIDELDDLGIDWYAGAPIIDRDDNHIGSFCIADSEKKEMTEEERKLMELFAEETMDKIRLKYEAEKGVKDKMRDIL